MKGWLRSSSCRLYTAQNNNKRWFTKEKPCCRNIVWFPPLQTVTVKRLLEPAELAQQLFVKTGSKWNSTSTGERLYTRVTCLPPLCSDSEIKWRLKLKGNGCTRLKRYSVERCKHQPISRINWDFFHICDVFIDSQPSRWINAGVGVQPVPFSATLLLYSTCDVHIQHL